MTKRQTHKKKTTSSKKRKSTRKKNQFTYTNNAIGALIVLVAVLGLAQSGIIGVFFTNMMRFLVGNLFIVGLAGLLGLGLTLLITGKLYPIKSRWWGSGCLILLGTLLLLSLQQFRVSDHPVNFFNFTWQKWADDLTIAGLHADLGGGVLTAGLFQVVESLLGQVGTFILAGLIIAVGLMILANISVNQVFAACQWLGKKILRGYQSLLIKWQKRSKKQPQPVSTKSIEIPETPEIVTEPKSTLSKTKEVKPSISVASQNQVKPQPPVQAEVNPLTAEHSSEPDTPMSFSQTNDKDYRLPTSSLLTAIPQNDQSDELKSIDKNAKVLQQTLDSFGVKAEIKHVSLGPSVTKYELHPAVGVKVSKIVNLADDIALALAAKDIRIEAPIPGKSLIGIEVPNKNIATVSFRDVIESQPDNQGHLLQVPLGKDVNGNVITADLAKMPHLLIAGSTGSGKSVSINGIITSILMNAKPSQVKLMLIDPKKVELGVYNGIPHLLSPVVSEPKKAARALQKVVSEMERRYELFAKYGQRKISTFNEFAAKNNEEQDVKIQPLPYIVVIVDELADLMMTVSNDVEAAIIRLAQMGRAAGIHMILATQRPSVDVITGLIKANVPSRIAFAVSSGIDSRTIIDANGAEKLLGRGDMLFLPIDKNTPSRVQGAFISDQDVARVADFITAQQTADYDETMMVSDEEIKAEDEAESEDDLFDDALDFVVDQQKASTSLLQRHFRIGYNRAARLIDELEQRGYIGPQDGSRPRQVYKQKE